MITVSTQNGFSDVKRKVDGYYVFDLRDGNGLVARDRYALVANAPFTITQQQIDDAVAIGEFEVTSQPLPDLAVEKAAALTQTYADVDSIYNAAVGHRGPEYVEAEADARAFAAANYAGTPSEYISAYAQSNATGQAQTNQWAADAIIARADALRAAQLSLRTQRFVSQAAIRAASTHTELRTALDTWDGFVATVRSQLAL